MLTKVKNIAPKEDVKQTIGALDVDQTCEIVVKFAAPKSGTHSYWF